MNSLKTLIIVFNFNDIIIIAKKTTLCSKLIASALVNTLLNKKGETLEDGKEKKSQILKIIKALAIIGIILIPQFILLFS